MPVADCGFDGQPDMLVSIGPTLAVRIGLDTSYDPDRGNQPNLGPDQFPALIDTGASESCIDASLADNLRLPVVDHQVITGIHGPAAMNMHLAQVHIPHFDFTINGQFAGVHLTSGGLPYYAIIGRDILRRFTMTYNGVTGRVTFESYPRQEPTP